MTTFFDQLPAHVAHSHQRVHVVVETPKGGRNKFAYDPDLSAFKLKGVLPEGHSFPDDFGFVPSTKAEDGDPPDVLLLLSAPAFTGCVVEARVIGALKLKQRGKDGQVMRNDRLLAVAADSREHRDIHEISDLSATMLTEIEHFFSSYNEAHGREIRVLRRVGPARATALLECALIPHGHA